VIAVHVRIDQELNRLAAGNRFDRRRDFFRSRGEWLSTMNTPFGPVSTPMVRPRRRGCKDYPPALLDLISILE